MKVLFVCAHNIARSPMSAAPCRELLGVNSQYKVRSVGIPPAHHGL
jgi:protein-tyrosine-phosphatase